MKKKTELEEKEKYLKSNFGKLEKGLKNIEKYIHDLKVENGKYRFLIDTIKPILLEQDIIQNLPYNKEKIITGTISEREELKRNLENQEKRVNTEKGNFIQFLNENSMEIRLRQMTISGLKNKGDFHEILEWQNNMEGDIQNPSV